MAYTRKYNEKFMHKLALKQVFSNSKYIILSILIFVVMFVPFMIILQFMFFEPFFTFSVPASEAFGFSLVVLISALSGLVLSMGVYRIRVLQTSRKKVSPSFAGTILGGFTGACGCISMNIALVPLLVPLAGLITFIEAYAIPLRLVSVSILGLSYFITVRGITSECKIDTKS